MHIGIDIRALQQFRPSGIGEYTLRLLQEFFVLFPEHQYTLFVNGVRNPDAYIPTWNFPHVRVVVTRYPNKILHSSIALLGYPKIDHILAKKSAPVDVFFSPHPTISSVHKDMRHVLTVHDISFALFPEYYSLKRQLWHKLIGARKQCEEADQIIVPSEATKQDLVRVYQIPPKKIAVIYSGVPVALTLDTTEVEKKFHLPKRFFLFIGTIEPRKNIETLIDAYVGGNFAAAGIGLVIAGAPGWKCTNLIVEMQKTTGVQYLGYVTHQEKQVLYTLADIFVFPSFYEGFGFPVLEAMAAGTPVVTSDCSSLPEITQGAAHLVSPYNPGALRHALTGVLMQPELCQRYCEQGKKVAAQYTWEKTARQTMAVLVAG